MASNSDHTRRDAGHAARMEIAVAIQRYSRRMTELAKGHIQEAIENAAREGRVIDGTELGRTAAADAIRSYIGSGEPRPAIESADTGKLGNGGAGPS